MGEERSNPGTNYMDFISRSRDLNQEYFRLIEIVLFDVKRSKSNEMLIQEELPNTRIIWLIIFIASLWMRKQISHKELCRLVNSSTPQIIIK